jgi:tRNA A-37 threonylcarbamoyl transferase component Bud32
MVAWKVALAAFCLAAEAGRVHKRDALDLESDSESMEELTHELADELMANMTFQIGFALGRLDFENDAALAADAPVRKFPSELRKDYDLDRLLACGYHGCAFLAKHRANNKVVVIKISSKGNGNQGAGAEECGRARYIQYSACGQGEAVMKAAQSYLPSCDAYGLTEKGKGYLVLPMAGGKDFNKFKKELKEKPLPVDQQKSIFAQLVAGVHAMHKSGVSHNDMHGKNVVINDNNQVAILDYGLGTSYPCSKSRNQNGYSRDANMLYAYIAMVSNCGKKNQWNAFWHGFVTDNNSYRRKQSRCMEHLRETWGIDMEFENALQKVLTGNIERDTDQHIEGLFNTAFVQKNLPKSTTRFQLEGTDQCYKWDKDKLKREMIKAGAVEFTCRK